MRFIKFIYQDRKLQVVVIGRFYILSFVIGRYSLHTKTKPTGIHAIAVVRVFLFLFSQK